MHKLIDYVCDELEELERKVDKGGKLSTTEVQYADMLAHLKKNLLKSEEMMEDGEYSHDYSYARGRTGNVRRDSMGRHSSRMYDGMSYGKDDIVMKLRDMEHDADPDSRHMIKKWIKQVEES